MPAGHHRTAGYSDLRIGGISLTIPRRCAARGSSRRNGSRTSRGRRAIRGRTAQGFGAHHQFGEFPDGRVGRFPVAGDGQFQQQSAGRGHRQVGGRAQRPGRASRQGRSRRRRYARASSRLSATFGLRLAGRRPKLAPRLLGPPAATWTVTSWMSHRDRVRPGRAPPRRGADCHQDESDGVGCPRMVRVESRRAVRDHGDSRFGGDRWFGVHRGFLGSFRAGAGNRSAG
jgi:hypothetical protein